MALLTVSKRRKYLRFLGYMGYTEKVIFDFQRRYFVKEKDIDGKYGKDTDILLRHVYNVNKFSKNFAPEEFKCQCGGKYCTGYPTYMKAKTLKLLQMIRDYFNRPVKITSGMRCERHNKNVGGVSNSKHKKGKAFDWYANNVTTDHGRRVKAINIIRNFPDHGYSYESGGYSSNGKISKSGSMGNSIHTNI